MVCIMNSVLLNVVLLLFVNVIGMICLMFLCGCVIWCLSRC